MRRSAVVIFVTQRRTELKRSFIPIQKKFRENSLILRNIFAQMCDKLEFSASTWTVISDQAYKLFIWEKWRAFSANSNSELAGTISFAEKTSVTCARKTKIIFSASHLPFEPMNILFSNVSYSMNGTVITIIFNK